MARRCSPPYPLGEGATLSSLLVPASAGITKPFHNPELLAGMGAILARVSRSRDARSSATATSP
jgi:DNA-binding response OmpR family regulator